MWYRVNMSKALKRGLTKTNKERMLRPDHPVTPQWFAWQLNTFQSDPRGERACIVQLIHDLNEVDKIASRKGYPEEEDLFRYAEGKQAKALLRRIEQTMRPVWLSPRLISPASGGWKTAWHTGTGTLFNFAVAWVFDLAVSGQLSKLRSCAYCGKWFAAARNLMSQRFCSVNCRISSHRKTPDGLQSRRTYMREYMREYRE